MLGTRGCRLGILYPEIYEMQVHAIMRAAKAVDEPPQPEVMIPLVAYEHEIEIMRDLVVRRRRRARHARAGGLHRRDDDRAAARVLRRRPHRPSRRLLLLRDQRPHPDRAWLLARRRRVQVHPRSTSTARSSTARRSRRSTRPASAGSCGSPPGSAAKPIRASSSGYAASTAAIRTRSPSSTRGPRLRLVLARSACRSRASPRPRRRSRLPTAERRPFAAVLIPVPATARAGGRSRRSRRPRRPRGHGGCSAVRERSAVT